MHQPLQPNPETRSSDDWPSELYRILKAADVRQMSYVPDAGHSQLIRLFSADRDVTTNVLTTEEEGIAHRRRRLARRPAQRAADAVERRRQLHQHAVAVGDRPLSAADAGDDARRMGRVQSLAGADEPGDAALAGGDRPEGDARGDRGTSVETVESAAALAYESDQQIAVLIGQRLIGKKKW